MIPTNQEAHTCALDCTATGMELFSIIFPGKCKCENETEQFPFYVYKDKWHAELTQADVWRVSLQEITETVDVPVEWTLRTLYVPYLKKRKQNVSTLIRAEFITGLDIHITAF